ncbi:MAG: hypothetical protein V1824_04730, partial [archaeon]
YISQDQFLYTYKDNIERFNLVKYLIIKKEPTFVFYEDILEASSNPRYTENDCFFDKCEFEKTVLDDKPNVNGQFNTYKTIKINPLGKYIYSYEEKLNDLYYRRQMLYDVLSTYGYPKTQIISKGELFEESIN